MAAYTMFDKLTELKTTYGQMLEVTIKEWKRCSTRPSRQEDIGNMLTVPLSMLSETANWQADALTNCLSFMDEDNVATISKQWCISIARQVEAFINDSTDKESLELYHLSHLMHTLRGTINWLDTVEDHFKNAV